MARGELNSVMRQLRRLAEPWGPGGLSDAELLERWLGRRDEAAFEVLVWRHGPMVLNVCRRVVHPPGDPEDAFQATFLTLVRKAAAIGKRQAVGSWLYKVAYRASLAANTRAAKRATHERLAAPGIGATPPEAEIVWRDLRPVLDAEVNGLPAKYRDPFILCYLEGRTVAEAALQLGCSRGTVGTRLAWARGRLRARLTRRGLALSAGALAAALSQGTAAALPAALVAATDKAAVLFAAGGPAAARISPQVITLTNKVVQTMFLSKLKVVTALGMALAGLLVGVSLAARRARSAIEGGGKPPDRPRVVVKFQDPGAKGLQKRKDRYGDPLPPRVLARLGTVRFRHGNTVYGLALSPNAKILASVGGNAQVHLWDADTGKEMHCLDGHGGSVHSVAFSLNGKTLITGGNDNTIRFWNVQTGRLLRRVESGEGDTLALVMCPRGKWLGTGSVGRAIQLRDPEKGTVVRSLKVKEIPAPRFRGATGVRALEFSADGTRLYSAGWGAHGIREWDPKTGKELRQFTCPRPVPRLRSLALSADGTTLASGGDYGDHTIRLWDVKQGKQTKLLAKQTGAVVALAFSPDGRTLASGGGRNNGTLVLWDVKKGEEQFRLGKGNTEVRGLLFARGGKRLLAGMGASIRLWGVATGKELLPRGGHHAYVCSVALSPDGRKLATAGADRTIRLWDVPSGKEGKPLTGHQAQVNSVVFSPGGKYLASGGYDNTVRLWDVARAKELHRFRGQRVATHSIAFSPDGGLLAAGEYSGGAVYLWKTATGELVRRINHPDGVMAVAFSPDGRTLACGSGIGAKKEKPGAMIRLFEVATGKERYHLKGDSYWVYGLAFSPDGLVLATAGSDQGVFLWEASTGKKLRRLARDHRYVNALAFSPDGRTLASSSGYGEQAIHLWEMATGKERLRLTGHRDSVLSLCFSRDGKTLASGSMDTTALLWDLTGVRTGKKVVPFTAREQDGHWKALAGADAQRAYGAVWALAGRPGQTVRFLEKHLRRLRPIDPQRVAQRIADLDSRRFAVRKQARKELEQWGDLVEGGLRKALAGKLSLEARQRVEQLLKLLTYPVGERLREVRAVEVLENIGTAAARRRLALLAKGVSGALLTREARAALERLARRAGEK
jgi:RNA polymerase sigma factor (sigma-70 family)